MAGLTITRSNIDCSYIGLPPCKITRRFVVGLHHVYFSAYFSACCTPRQDALSALKQMVAAGKANMPKVKYRVQFFSIAMTRMLPPDNETLRDAC